MAQCADFSATDVSGVPGLCRMNAGENQGVITYQDGRVAVTTDHNAGQPDGFYIQPPPGDADRTPVRLQLSNDIITRMRTLQGIEYGNCSATGLGSNISSLGFLQTTYNGSAVTWGPEHLREVYRLLGQTDGQSANAFICSDNRNVGRIGVNNDIGHRASLLAAITALEDSSGFLGFRDLFHMDSSTGGLDYLHRNALLQSLRAAAGVPNPPSTFLEILKYGGGLLGVAVAFGIAVPWLQKKFGPKDPPGGHGGGGTPVANNQQGTPATQTAAPVTNPPTAARVRAVNRLAAGIMNVNGGGQPGNVPGVVVPTVNGVNPGVGVLPSPVGLVPPVGVPAVPPVVVEVPVGGALVIP